MHGIIDSQNDTIHNYGLRDKACFNFPTANKTIRLITFIWYRDRTDINIPQKFSLTELYIISLLHIFPNTVVQFNTNCQL